MESSQVSLPDLFLVVLAAPPATTNRSSLFRHELYVDCVRRVGQVPGGAGKGQDERGSDKADELASRQGHLA